MSLKNLRMCTEKLSRHATDEIKRIKSKSNSHNHFKKLRAAFYVKKLWPAGTTLKIGFVTSGDDAPRTPISQIEDVKNSDGTKLLMDPLQPHIQGMSTKDVIKTVVNTRIAPLVNLNIVFVDDPVTANIRISFEDSGSWSLVGTDCLNEKKEPTMNFGWIDVSTICHEFGHALGMIHEHQSPNGNPIHWDLKKLYNWGEETQGWGKQEVDEQIVDKYDLTLVNGSTFDPLSIMLYFFPAELTVDNKGTHQNLRLSGLDAEWISNMYPGGRETPDDFYSKTFNMDLSKAIELSENDGKPKPEPSRTILIVSVSLAVLFFFMCLYYFWKKKNFKNIPQ
jgi:hypothetical protein